MNVCFFSQYSSTNNAGASLSMFDIANEMAERGLNITIILACDCNLENIHIDSHIKIIQKRFYSMRMTIDKLRLSSHPKFLMKYIYNKFAAKKIAVILEKEKPDIMHINGLDNAVGADVAKILNTPYVWHIRQFLEEDFGQRLFAEDYLYSLLRKSAEIIAISNDVKKKFELKIGKKIKVIYNGIPVGQYQEVRNIDFSKDIRILLTGRIYKQKGQDIAIKAISSLLEFFRGGAKKYT